MNQTLGSLHKTGKNSIEQKCIYLLCCPKWLMSTLLSQANAMSYFLDIIYIFGKKHSWEKQTICQTV